MTGGTLKSRNRWRTDDSRLFEQNEIEYYTQSYSRPEEAGEEGTGTATGESDEGIKAKVKKVNKEIRRKATESKEKEKDFVYPDVSQECKYYTEGGHTWRESRSTGEKGWWDYRYFGFSPGSLPLAFGFSPGFPPCCLGTLRLASLVGTFFPPFSLLLTAFGI